MVDEEMEEARKEAGIKKQVFNAWSEVMQALWTSSINYFKAMGADPKLLPVNGENEILIGDLFKIDATMCNNEYVEARLWEKEKQLAFVRYEGNVNPICQCFFIIIKYKFSPS
jgi:hypothetical protein